jgi:hypothetical protein
VTIDPTGLVVSGLVSAVDPVLASDVTFGIVFGIFVAALAVLGVVAVRWGIRRDRPGRQAWRERQLRATPSDRADAPPGWPGNDG